MIQSVCRDLHDKALQGARNYHSVYGVYPAKIIVHFAHAHNGFDVTQIVFPVPVVMPPFYTSVPVLDALAPSFNYHTIPIELVARSDISFDDVHLPHPRKDRLMSGVALERLARFVSRRKVERIRTLRFDQEYYGGFIS